ncbi:unnamed protein product [Meloidogyne enterolobii]|uniref:Uncharacterized protein n=1 Tax=Meloidogyne enterolobii TaxID=390850 RepID=A0ACB0Z0H6_MELEN
MTTNTFLNQQNFSSSPMCRLFFPFVSSTSPAISSTTESTERQQQQNNCQKSSRLNSRRNYSSNSSLFAAIFASLCVFAVHLPAVAGLACYETVNITIIMMQKFLIFCKLFLKIAGVYFLSFFLTNVFISLTKNNHLFYRFNANKKIIIFKSA